MTRRTLSHTADTGLEATAPTFATLLEELAAGMFESMASPDCTRPGVELTTTVTAATREDLVVDVLSDLLYLSETEGAHLCSFEVTDVEGTTITIRARGVPVTEVEPLGPAIKAVTYHRLEVSEHEGTWRARVYFDV